MPIYTGIKSVLQSALGDYANMGFELLEPDDHILEIYFKDLQIGRLWQDQATIPAIHQCCQSFLDNNS